MKKQQSGFTLIELVVVIVILGILAATALPKFVDMSGEAEAATTQGVAGAVSSAGSVNYAKYKAAGGISTGAKAIDNTDDACAQVAAAGADFLTGSVSLVTADPANSNQYKIAESGTLGACSAGAVIQCTITSKGGKTATAYVPCTN